MRPFWTLSAAGFAATAITYGPARMGFGLFLSEFRDSFDLTTGMAGQISSIGFFGFLLGLLAAYFLTSRAGPRAPVLTGLASATVGMGIVAAAPTVPVLTVGVFLAMASAGFSWAPFNNAVNRQVTDAFRPTALSIVSTGTTIGIGIAGATALALAYGGFPWRVCWAAFAGGSALAWLANWAALRPLAGDPGYTPNQPWSDLVEQGALPLYGAALSFGITTTVYISFAADRVAGLGGVPGIAGETAPAVLFVIYAAFGLAGLATGGVKDLIGLPRLLQGLFAASAVSLLAVAAIPTGWTGLVLSAGLQGAFVMMTSAVLAFWSERLFPTLPSLSFTAALLAVAVGSVIGPVAAGYAADAVGGGIMFAATAGISALTAVAMRPRLVRERAASG